MGGPQGAATSPHSPTTHCEGAPTPHDCDTDRKTPFGKNRCHQDSNPGPFGQTAQGRCRTPPSQFLLCPGRQGTENPRVLLDNPYPAHLYMVNNVFQKFIRTPFQEDSTTIFPLDSIGSAFSSSILHNST
ncbi:hypothetical protein Fcan01_26500 [Folsomia candida]|uniref:Uncharacterized protein n=1 Tax=Folsomia candida TaxID=158441 RepID=A0A226D2B1_FOLCA|nr:hypothetical protein Fcan01_26500 [Folsomia candida]